MQRCCSDLHLFSSLLDSWLLPCHLWLVLSLIIIRGSSLFNSSFKKNKAISLLLLILGVLRSGSLAAVGGHGGMSLCETMGDGVLGVPSSLGTAGDGVQELQVVNRRTPSRVSSSARVLE